MTGRTTFPGGTSVTLLDVYDDAGPDGFSGGSPHMHLASTECYVVIGGRGSLHTLSLDGVRETELRPGTVVWFTPGTIHRAINEHELKVLVLMDNSGLPEAGDAVMTFPADVVADAARYAQEATLPRRVSSEERAHDARRRRDLAVDGYSVLRAAMVRGEDGPLKEFYAAAGRLVRERTPEWESIITDGPLAQATRSLDAVRALKRGLTDHLALSSLQQAPHNIGERAFGMCGRLRAYDVQGERSLYRELEKQ
jgi:mannose-6-phosphate isomerase-like protein (cupin superfamily)